MKKITFLLISLFLKSNCIYGSIMLKDSNFKRENFGIIPTLLYKIVSYENWELSKDSDKIYTDANDKEFIHFSTEDQWPKIIEKRYSDKKWVLLTINTSKLNGTWELEWDKNQTDKWWHLYNGSVPKDSIIEYKESWK